MVSIEGLKNKKKINKIARQAGCDYHDVKGNVKSGPVFRFETCKCPYGCETNLGFDVRKTLFDTFWALANWNAQTIFIASSVKEVRFLFRFGGLQA